MNDTSAGSETRIPLELIEPNPWQVRLSEDDEAVENLAISIEANGLMQVPTARPSTVKRPDGKYGWQLAFGHTRFAAFKHLADQGKAEYGSMPLLIRELTDQQMFERAVAENVQRRDLTPIEEATAMQRAMTDFKFTSAQAGELFGVAAETVRGTVRLLKLPEPLREMVAGGTMTVRAARQFLTVQRIDPKGAKRAAVEIAKLEDAGVEPVDRELDDVLRRSDTVINMWRDARGQARGGDGLWPLSWNVKPEQLDPFTEKDLKALSKEHLANPPKCIECPFYSKLQDEHYCGMKACHARKEAAWLRLEISRFSKKLEIPVYDPKKDGKQIHPWVSSYDDWAKGFHSALENKKDPARAGLRLQVYADNGQRYFQDLPGTDHERIMIVDVAGGVKPQKRSSYSSGRDTGYQRRHLAIKRSEDFVEQVAAPAFAHAFAGVKVLAVLEAATSIRGYSQNFNATQKKEYGKMAEAAKRRFLQAEMARALIMDERSVLDYRSPYSETVWSKGPVAVAEALRKKAKAFEVKLPADWNARAKAMMPPRPAKKTKAKKSKKK